MSDAVIFLMGIAIILFAGLNCLSSCFKYLKSAHGCAMPGKARVIDITDYLELTWFKGEDYIEVRPHGLKQTRCKLCNTKFGKRWTFKDYKKFNLTEKQITQMILQWYFTEHFPKCPIVVEATANPDNAEKAQRGENWKLHGVSKDINFVGQPFNFDKTKKLFLMGGSETANAMGMNPIGKTAKE